MVGVVQSYAQRLGREAGACQDAVGPVVYVPILPDLPFGEGVVQPYDPLSRQVAEVDLVVAMCHKGDNLHLSPPSSSGPAVGQGR